MKKLLAFTILASSLYLVSCNSEKAQNKAIQDSLAKAAAADSMLKEALKEDSISAGAKSKETLNTDTSK